MFSVVFALFFVYSGYPLMDVSIPKGFVHSAGCLLTQMMESFAVQELHQFTASPSLIAGLNASSVKVLVSKFVPLPGS